MKKEVIVKFYIKHKLYIFPAIVAISSLILIIFVIFPQISKLIFDQKTESELRFKSEFLEVKAQTLESYDALDLSNKVNYTLSSFPGDKDFGNVIGLIQNLTSQSGFNITSMTIGTSGSKQANSQSYNIQLNVNGLDSLIGVLLSNIEASTRLIRVGSIEVSKTVDQQVINVALSLDILYAPIPTSFGSVDSPLPELSKKNEELLAKLASSITPTVVSTETELPARGRANPFE